MSRRAVIYVRISSESQEANSSPNEQEADCRCFAQEKRLQVVRVVRCQNKWDKKNE